MIMCVCVFCVLMRRRPPRSTRTYTLFPYTTLFRSALRSVLCGAVLACMAGTASAGFADPLDTPAIASALSDQHLINGLARAGDRQTVDRKSTRLHSSH